MACSNLVAEQARATRFSASANAKHLIHGQKCWPPAPIGVVPSGSRRKADASGRARGRGWLRGERRARRRVSTIIALCLFLFLVPGPPCPFPSALLLFSPSALSVPRLSGLARRAKGKEEREESIAYHRQRAALGSLHEKHKLSRLAADREKERETGPDRALRQARGLRENARLRERTRRDQ